MITKIKNRGQANVVGPFVIRRRRKPGQQLAGRVLYKQRTGGWSSNPDAAWKFDTEQAALFVLRSNEGEVVSVEDLDGVRPDGLAGVPQAGRTAGQAECEPGVFDVAPTATAGTVIISGKLNASERERKTKLEGEIEDGRAAFLSVGSALVEIRERRLYRDEFGTFEDYMRVKWGFSARHGHRLCDAAEVMQNLLPAAGSSDQLVTLPKTESQARELARLPAAEQKPAWEEAQASAPDGKVTAQHVAQAVRRRIAPKVEPEAEPKLPHMGPQKCVDVLARCQDAVVAIRALQDLLSSEVVLVAECERAVGRIVSVEEVVKGWRRPSANGKPVMRWVICRDAIQGSTTSSGRVRYAGQHEDWTFDPKKVTPWTVYHDALKRAKCDRVMELDKAIRRFENRL